MAIDGKTVRRSHDLSRGQQAIHLVTAWASANSMTLGQVKVERKSNEITTIPKLLGLLALHGCIVTIDAMGCQREIAEQFVEAGADYVLALKENQGQLYDDVRDLFQGAEEFGFEGVPHDYARTLNKGDGRLETRECWAVTDPESLDYLQTKWQWAGIKAMVKISARRETASGATVQPSYYISSLDAPAGTMLKSVRRHWSIENSLHWTLDVTYREDQCRERKDHAPQNLALFARFPKPPKERDQPQSWHPRQTPQRRLARGLPSQSPPRLRRDCPDGKGRYQDNIIVERLCWTVNYEEVYLKAGAGAGEARKEFWAYFHFYNNQRPHQALRYRAPAEGFHGHTMAVGEEVSDGNRLEILVVEPDSGAVRLSLNSPPILSN